MVEEVSKPPLLSNRAYDVLKQVVQIVLPAVATLYFALSQIWGLPYGEQVVGTVAALSVFLGAILGLSSLQYKASEDRFDGSLEIKEGKDNKLFRLRLRDDPDQLEGKNEVLFKVDPDISSNPDSGGLAE
jgi:imidazoleglycerol phosphate synthase glutamine amidotransferase subunit HisH